MQTKLQLYQKVTPLAQLGIWERNLVNGEVYWNPVIRDILEVGDDFEPAEQPATQFYLDRAAIIEMIETAKNTGEPQAAELQLRTAKGNLRWVKVRIRADLENGNCTLIYGSLEDITESVVLIRKLRESEEQFHQAFDFAPIGMALVSLEGRWMRVNHTLCRLFGYEAEALLRTTFQELTVPEDLEADLALLQRLLAGELNTYHLEKRYLHQDGSVIWALLYVTLVRDEQGVPLYFVSQIKDITERKQMELERSKTLEIITAQNQRLLNFAHIVSHNLRSHTGNIQMVTDMISKEQDPVEKEHLISMLGINAANLQETLMHLNEVVDVQAHGRQTLKPLNLLQEVNKIAELLAVQLRQADGHIIIDVPNEIELNYDQAYLESILLNLLTNAIKYRDARRPLQISVRAERRRDDLTLEIADNGIGIDLATHGHKLFGMYKTFNGNADARGIGLFLVKNQVEVMGGRITARSMPGQGTTFIIEF